MKSKKDLVKNLLDKAEKDLLAAQHELSFSEPVTESICFHYQQAVEKYIKAYLLFLNIPFIKTHEIGELLTKIEGIDDELVGLKGEADQLTDYAVEIRYPDELFEPSLDESREAFDIANKIKGIVLRKISA